MLDETGLLDIPQHFFSFTLAVTVLDSADELILIAQTGGMAGMRRWIVSHTAELRAQPAIRGSDLHRTPTRLFRAQHSYSDISCQKR